MSSPEILSALRPVIAAFDRLDVPYQIGGSVASSAYGVARTSLDVDVVAKLEAGHAQPLVQMLKKEFYLDETAISEAIHNHSSFNLIHLETMLKVDVFVLKTRHYDQQSLARRKADRMNDESRKPLFFASPEDVILNKLEWYTLGNQVSERQWNDVRGILKVQKDNLDYGYLRTWAGQLGLTELLEKALKGAGC